MRAQILLSLYERKSLFGPVCDNNELRSKAPNMHEIARPIQNLTATFWSNTSCYIESSKVIKLIFV